MNTFGLLKGFLTALRTQIVEDGIFSANNIQLSLFDDDNLDKQFPQGSPLLEIIPKEFNSLGWDEGASVYGLALRGMIQFKIIIMSVVDAIQTDNTVMTSTDQTLGIYELADQLVAEIEMLSLCDGNGNSYLVEPARVKRYGKPQRATNHPEWVIMNIEAEVSVCQTIVGVS